MLSETIKKELDLLKSSATPMDELTTEALKSFEHSGFPTTKHEEWKYTSLKLIAEKDFAVSQAFSPEINDFLQRSISSAVKANRLVFVNGFYREELSTLLDQKKGLTLSGLLLAKQNNMEAFRQHFGKYIPMDDASLNSLNTALFTDGAFIHLEDNVTLDYPVSIVNLVDSSSQPVFAQPRNLIVLGRNSKLVLIESYYATGSNSSFTNVVNEVFADEGSTLEYYKIQREMGERYQNNFTQIVQMANTNINHVTLTLDGTLVRNNLHFLMNGEHSNSLLYGLYITSGTQHVDNHTRVDHAKPNCFSDEKYKGILKDKSTAVFNGKILVHLDAQKTNAYQRNQNILLSDEATVNTKPQLEIFADDVKCTHGATIGQIDEEPMFYLRSRGIPEDVARKILLTAFAEDIAEKLKIPEMVTLMENQIEAKL